MSWVDKTVDKDDRRRRVEHEVLLQPATASYGDGTKREVEVWAIGGQPATAA